MILEQNRTHADGISITLDKASTSQLQLLSQALWSWSTCAECLGSKPCDTEDCPRQQSTILGPLLEIYEDLTASYEADVKIGEEPGLRTHEDLFSIIEVLKSDPDITESHCSRNYFRIDPLRVIRSVLSILLSGR
jgi:hypothetical protein